MYNNNIGLTQLLYTSKERKSLIGSETQKLNQVLI